MFRRRKSDQVVDQETGADQDAAPSGPRADGPWDLAEVQVDEDDSVRVDLGGLLVTPHDALDLQLQVDEGSGQVIAAVLAGEDGAVELRAFAAPRNGDIWDDVRRQVSAEVARMGGTATETDGPYGPALKVSLTVQRPEGGSATQVSQVLGIAGPRWLLRATLFGRPAVDFQPDGVVETTLREVVVVRGTSPIPPGDPIPLTVPPSAQRMDQ